MWHGNETAKGWEDDDGHFIPFSMLTDPIRSLTDKDKRVNAFLYSCHNAQHLELMQAFAGCIAFETIVSRVHPRYSLPPVLNWVRRGVFSAESFENLFDELTTLTLQNVSAWASKSQQDKLTTLCCFQHGELCKRHCIEEVENKETGRTECMLVRPAAILWWATLLSGPTKVAAGFRTCTETHPLSPRFETCVHRTEPCRTRVDRSRGSIPPLCLCGSGCTLTDVE